MSFPKEQINLHIMQNNYAIMQLEVAPAPPARLSPQSTRKTARPPCARRRPPCTPAAYTIWSDPRSRMT